MIKDGQTIDTHTQRIGFRRVELVQDPLQEADQYGKGTTFYFRVNGIPIFAGGMCALLNPTFLSTASSSPGLSSEDESYHS
jgi:beta-mannosidase